MVAVKVGDGCLGVGDGCCNGRYGGCGGGSWGKKLPRRLSLNQDQFISDK